MTDCIFCKIIRGEIPSFKIYEDEKTFAILDIRPVSAGHTLVLPKNPAVRNVFEVTQEDWSAVMETVRKLSGIIEKAMGAEGVSLMVNNGAGQMMADHLHIHIIPRFKTDELKDWPQREYKEGEAKETLSKILSSLA